jgi:hypothetical protein
VAASVLRGDDCEGRGRGEEEGRSIAGRGEEGRAAAVRGEAVCGACGGVGFVMGRAGLVRAEGLWGQQAIGGAGEGGGTG